MKLHQILGSTAGLCALAALSLGACRTPTLQQSNHWRIDSIGPRVSYHFFGYVGERDGPVGGYEKRELKSIGLTLRRHLLNDNPSNPLQRSGLGRTDWRPSQKPPPWPESKTD
jgi:hypothetical protein